MRQSRAVIIAILVLAGLAALALGGDPAAAPHGHAGSPIVTAAVHRSPAIRSHAVHALRGQTGTLLSLRRVGRVVLACDARDRSAVTFAADRLLPSADAVVTRGGRAHALTLQPERSSTAFRRPAKVLAETWQLAPFAKAGVRVVLVRVVSRPVPRAFGGGCAASATATTGPDQGPTGSFASVEPASGGHRVSAHGLTWRLAGEWRSLRPSSAGDPGPALAAATFRPPWDAWRLRTTEAGDALAVPPGWLSGAVAVPRRLHRPRLLFFAATRPVRGWRRGMQRQLGAPGPPRTHGVVLWVAEVARGGPSAAFPSLRGNPFSHRSGFRAVPSRRGSRARRAGGAWRGYRFTATVTASAGAAPADLGRAFTSAASLALSGGNRDCSPAARRRRPDLCAGRE